VEGPVKKNPPMRDLRALTAALTGALAQIDDLDRDGMRDTPARWAKMLLEMTAGHEFTMTTFVNPDYDEMVVETGIPFHSLCEHHLAPFFGTATVAYIPDGRIVGISKLARVVEHFSRQLQVQERMTQQVANLLQKELKPLGVAVMVTGRHMCQEMRGVRKHGVETVTSCLKGVFKDTPEARAEFLEIARRGK
jgi:GTP cyclohydrolase I